MVSSRTSSDSARNRSLHLWDERTGPEMFWLSLFSLILLAGIFHLHERREHLPIFHGCLLGFLGLYPAYWIDCYWARRLRSRDGGYHWLYAMFPPLRLGAKDHETNRLIWLPVFGWRITDFELERRVQRALRVPMIVMALLIIPLLATEYFCAFRIGNDHLLAALTAAASAIIWAAFTAEFVVMAAISRSKIDYCKQHFLELLIILLPLLGFLGSIQLGRELRINQITKAANLYRLRGLLNRTWQALTMFQFVDRILSGPPQKHLHRLKIQLEVKEDEIDQLRNRIRMIESKLRKRELKSLTVERPSDPLSDDVAA